MCKKKPYFFNFTNFNPLPTPFVDIFPYIIIGVPELFFANPAERLAI